MLNPYDSKSRFGMFLGVALSVGVGSANADTPSQRDYWSAALRWARDLGVTDRCYDEISTASLKTEAEAGATAIHPGFWAGISGTRQTEAEQLASAMMAAHAAGYASDEVCFMALMVRDSSRKIVESRRRLLELGG